MIFKRSLIAELANLAGAVFTVLFTIVLAVAMVRFLNMAAGGSIEHGTVVQLVLYNALVNLPPLLAASLFIATLMTLMRSWQDNEMVVWFSSGGRSILSWIEPTVKFALPIVVVIALLSIVISPWARAETDRLRNSVSAREDVNAIAPGRFIEAMGGKRVFFVESAEEGGNQVRNVFMAEGDWGKESVVTAEKGTIEVNAEGDRYVVLLSLAVTVCVWIFALIVHCLYQNQFHADCAFNRISDTRPSSRTALAFLMARSRTFACTSRYSAFLYFTAGRTQSESVDGCASFYSLFECTFYCRNKD